jgi:hypothetical protein
MNNKYKKSLLSQVDFSNSYNDQYLNLKREALASNITL